VWIKKDSSVVPVLQSWLWIIKRFLRRASVGMTGARGFLMGCPGRRSRPGHPPIFIGHNVNMKESYISAVISTSVRGEISSNKRTSPIVEVTVKRICHWQRREESELAFWDSGMFL
jgi:hypothetical protein